MHFNPVGPVDQMPVVNQESNKKSEEQNLASWFGRSAKKFREVLPYLKESSQNIHAFIQEITRPQSKEPSGMRYEDLSKPDKRELRETILRDNLSYAAYMYGGAKKRDLEETRDAMQFTVDVVNNNVLYWKAKPIDDAKNQVLLNIAKGCLEMGFQVDEAGNFYHLETGTIFNLVYDLKKQEVAICFMGLGNAIRLSVPEDQQKKINSAALKATISNSVGHVPQAISQAMRIGRLMKNKIAETGIQPVMVGHSHGGVLAQAAAIANGLKGVVFNPEPVGIGTKAAIDKRIGVEKRKAFAKRVTAFSVKGDWLSDGKINAFCQFARDYGLPVPTVMGKGYYLPEIEGSLKDKHCEFLAAFCKLKAHHQQEQGMLPPFSNPLLFNFAAYLSNKDVKP